MPGKQRKLLGRLRGRGSGNLSRQADVPGYASHGRQVLKQVAQGMPWDAITAEWRGAVPRDAIAEAWAGPAHV